VSAEEAAYCERCEDRVHVLERPRVWPAHHYLLKLRFGRRESSRWHYNLPHKGARNAWEA